MSFVFRRRAISDCFQPRHLAFRLPRWTGYAGGTPTGSRDNCKDENKAIKRSKGTDSNSLLRIVVAVLCEHVGELHFCAIEALSRDENHKLAVPLP